MGARSIVMSVSVCLCMRLSIRDHVSETTRPIFTKFLVHVTYVCGSVLLWRRSDMLHISGFVDDVIFAHKLIDCSMSPPGWGNEGHTQSSAWRVGIPVAGSRRSGLLLAVRAYTRPQWACWIFMTWRLHIMFLSIIAGRSLRSMTALFSSLLQFCCLYFLVPCGRLRWHTSPLERT